MMNKKIIVRWLEDEDWSNVIHEVNKYVGESGLDIFVMASFPDVLHLCSDVKGKNLNYIDSLILDCRMGSENHICYSPVPNVSDIKKFSSKLVEGKKIEKLFFKKYYDNLEIGGLYVWKYLQDQHVIRSSDRVILYSADFTTRQKYSVLHELGLLRFYKKVSYLFPDCPNPIEKANEIYEEALKEPNSCRFYLIGTDDEINISDLKQLDPKNLQSGMSYYPVYVNKQDNHLFIELLDIQCGQKNLHNYLNEQRKKTAFLQDLFEIGMEYIQSAEVDRNILESILENKDSDYWTKPLSDNQQEPYWTFQTLFPAYYNPGGIFCNDKNARDVLEAEIKQKTFLNWTYELGRVLRTGGFFYDGHVTNPERDNRNFYSFEGIIVNKDNFLQNITEQSYNFQKRTGGYKLPFTCYKTTLKNDETRIALPYYHGASHANHQPNMEDDLQKIISTCKKVLDEKNIQVKIFPIGDFVCKASNNKKATETYPTLIAFPTPSINGFPAARKDLTLFHPENGGENPWTLDKILNKDFFIDIFSRDCWNKGNDHAIAFCKGQVSLNHKCKGDLYYRFLCVARTTLCWDTDRMEGDEFLNKTKRLQWYMNGLHHHARIFILSSPKEKKDTFFDLSKGPTNQPDIEQRPHQFQVAHEFIINLLKSNEDLKKYEFCSFVYVGYDVIQGAS